MNFLPAALDSLKKFFLSSINSLLKEFYNRFTGMLFMAFIIQFYLGIMTLLMKVPVLLGVMHQGMAALIVLILVQIKFSVTSTKTINR